MKGVAMRPAAGSSRRGTSSRMPPEKMFEIKAESMPIPEKKTKIIKRPSTAPPLHGLGSGAESPRRKRLSSNEGVFLAQYKTENEATVAYRSAEERSANPERLSLDRRSLKACPILKSEERVRLLNYQNNEIERISNLGHLPNLIFLDLYNNCIECLSKDLDDVPTLRVLMLGKNRIKTISHLGSLAKLDVLDLHSNAISKIENLDHLTQLRVLNLAGNRLTTLDSLQRLRSLTELNARRNHIESATDLDVLEALRRVFLSNNRISQLDQVSCIFRARHLTELSMDGNPIEAAMAQSGGYRKHAILHIPTLRQLDLREIGQAERRAIDIEFRREDQRERETRRQDAEERQKRAAELARREAISAAQRDWAAANHHCQDSLCESSQRREPQQRPQQFPTCAATVTPDTSPEEEDEQPTPRQISFPTAVTTSKKGRRHGSSRKTKAAATPGYYEVGPLTTTGDKEQQRSVQVYGDGFGWLENDKVVSTATSLACRFVSLDRAMEKLKPHAKKSTSFAKLELVVFSDNAIRDLRQVASLVAFLAALAPSIEDLRIESNPVCSLQLLRPFVACVSSTKLKRFNGVSFGDAEESATTERDEARRRLGPLVSMLGEQAKGKRREEEGDYDDRGVARGSSRGGCENRVAMVQSAIAKAYAAERRRREFNEKLWPQALAEIVSGCCLDDDDEDDGVVQQFFEKEPVW